MIKELQVSGFRSQVSAAVAPLSSLRFLFALTARARTLDGPTMVNELQLEALEEHRGGLQAAAVGAAGTEGGLVVLTGRLRAAQAPESPGGEQITPEEARPLQRALARLRQSATTHTRHLEGML